jgi:hypothetical protein
MKSLIRLLFFKEPQGPEPSLLLTSGPVVTQTTHLVPATNEPFPGRDTFSLYHSNEPVRDLLTSVNNNLTRDNTIWTEKENYRPFFEKDSGGFDSSDHTLVPVHASYVVSAELPLLKKYAVPPSSSPQSINSSAKNSHPDHLVQGDNEIPFSDGGSSFLLSKNGISVRDRFVTERAPTKATSADSSSSFVQMNTEPKFPFVYNGQGITLADSNQSNQRQHSVADQQLDSVFVGVNELSLSSAATEKTSAVTTGLFRLHEATTEGLSYGAQLATSSDPQQQGIVHTSRPTVVQPLRESLRPPFNDNLSNDISSNQLSSVSLLKSGGQTSNGVHSSIGLSGRQSFYSVTPNGLLPSSGSSYSELPSSGLSSSVLSSGGLSYNGMSSSGLSSSGLSSSGLSSSGLSSSGLSSGALSSSGLSFSGLSSGGLSSGGVPSSELSSSGQSSSGSGDLSVFDGQLDNSLPFNSLPAGDQFTGSIDGSYSPDLVDGEINSDLGLGYSEQSSNRLPSDGEISDGLPLENGPTNQLFAPDPSSNEEDIFGEFPLRDFSSDIFRPETNPSGDLTSDDLYVGQPPASDFSSADLVPVSIEAGYASSGQFSTGNLPPSEDQISGDFTAESFGSGESPFKDELQPLFYNDIQNWANMAASGSPAASVLKQPAYFAGNGGLKGNGGPKGNGGLKGNVGPKGNGVTKGNGITVGNGDNAGKRGKGDHNIHYEVSNGSTTFKQSRPLNK